MKLLVTAIICALMALPMSAHDDDYGYHHGEYEYSMSSKQADEVVDLIKSISFDDNKLKAAKVCLKLRLANTDCIRKIAKSFTFSDAKKKFLYYAIDYCTDVQNYYSLRDILSFSSEQVDFMNFVDEYIKDNSTIQSGRR